jgi:site-specific DNA recombinase
MTAAIYARKSSDDSDRNEEARSTTRQVERATEYARAHGWAIDPAHVFVDENVSGAVPLEARPAGAALLKALHSGSAQFGALVVSELSRIGRDGVRTPYTVQQIEEAGVEIHGYLSGQRISVDDEQGEMQTMLHSLAASYERRRAKQRTHDALLSRARAGHVPNGVCFGYANVPADGHSTRVVVPEEAAVIRRLFAMAADGAGYQRIARTLNDAGAPAPYPRRPGRPRSWSTTTVRDALHRELYRGRIIWNRRRREIRRGKRTFTMRPEGEWITRDAPELQIISDELWQRVRERLSAARTVYFEKRDAKRATLTVNGKTSPYLLTGLLSCAACTGTMFSHRHGHQNRLFFSYMCTNHHVRGRAICKNGLEANMVRTDAAVLEAVERDVLNVAVLETALWKALAAGRAPDDDRDTAALRAELARLDAEVGRLAGAIATGGDLPSLVALLREREQRRGYVRTVLAERDRERASRRDRRQRRDALDVMRAALADWRGMLRANPGSARQALCALLGGRLLFTPQEGESGERFYSFEGPGTVSPIIAGVVAAACPKAGAARR